MVEIERKFLVLSNAYKTEANTKTRIVQGFLNTDPERTVRIRIKGDQGFITVKGKGNTTGVSRFEWEKEIAVPEAEALLKIAEPGSIDKFRYEVQVGKHIFEVDEFFGENEGLIVAEVELSSEEEAFEKPNWLGEEVSGITKYYNSQLSKNPFKKW
ncbi:CYTH domain-containing protein [Cellulophaga sp. E16_2]|uniref:Adenylate cyclase n=1 Tax=Cellulophaga algicola (strain DSM 14237 / IC166 / ACAM 630) TaxID=688270 RepID=E6X7Y6_CELAD|nr:MULTISPECIES: CYTH domain-containing protein [Cellulophaga]ADV48584.1 adenylate cyclase [Cellulophaga algicola DSM 14237]MBO0591002.1 CYTH domain-containing protein [Cellulophaga sp. E16_2]